MNGFRWRTVWGIVAVVALALTALLHAQATRPRVPADPLAGLKVGHWIRLVGRAQGASPLVCRELRLMTGDFLDDDWSLQGTVKAVHAERREFTIGACRIQVSDNTTYDSPRRNFTGYADLRPGSYVEADGTLLTNGILLATEVDDETARLAQEPTLKDEIKVVGKIERVDTRRRVIAIMGMEFQVTAQTRVRSVIR